VAPADPTHYSAALLLQPIEWLVSWWRRRPLSKLLRLADQVQNLQEYGQLVSKIFGGRIDPRALEVDRSAANG
jgi:hypothetical protein